MKSGIHPTYFKEATITCSCGAVLETGSTVETMHTEICSQCHPFYTGKKKFIDTTGRVDRFKKLAEKSEAKQVARLKASDTKTKAVSEKAEKKTKKDVAISSK
jgi:large subunit ribosomal protein L31